MTRATRTADPRPGLREEQKHLTRNRVLDAAVTVLDAKSVVDTTMEDIARAAGVTRVTVYAHFPGKAEVLRALLARASAITDEVYADLAALPTWTRTTIRTWLESTAARWRDMAPTIRVLTSAGPTTSHDAGRPRDLYRTSHERYVSMLTDDGRPWRATSSALARQQALMAILQLESFLSIWLAGDWPVDTEDPLDPLADALCHLLGPALDE